VGGIGDQPDNAMAAALSGLELEYRFDGFGAGAFNAARRRALGIDLELARRATGGNNGKFFQDRIGAVEGLQVPAQRQRVAPITLAIKKRLEGFCLRALQSALEFCQPVFD
jgi:hypothetical protein